MAIGFLHPLLLVKVTTHLSAIVCLDLSVKITFWKFMMLSWFHKLFWYIHAGYTLFLT